ncbi:hypothetical protein JCM4914_36670 [Streptomyces platensis subsp. malvinus]
MGVEVAVWGEIFRIGLAIGSGLEEVSSHLDEGCAPRRRPPARDCEWGAPRRSHAGPVRVILVHGCGRVGRAPGFRPGLPPNGSILLRCAVLEMDGTVEEDLR